MRPILQVFLTLSLLLGASAALAWSTLGHGLVGELAQRQLTPAARAEVAALLAGEPDPTLAGVASWADTLRSASPEQFERTARWHYVNFPPGQCRYRPQRDCPDGDCVIGAIEQQRAILADRTQPREARRDALKFVVHFVGDVHQPMHAGNRRDKGGNDFQVSLRTDIAPPAYARERYDDGVMGTNLHAIWDFYVLASPGLDLQQYADRLDSPARSTATGNLGNAAAWAGESCRLLDSRQLYPDGHRMDKDYLDAQRPLAEQRVRQAAHRLAALLNATLSD